MTKVFALNKNHSVALLTLVPVLLLLLLSVFMPSPFTVNVMNRVVVTSSSSSERKAAAEETIVTSTTADIFGVKIEKNPPQSKLDDLGVASWPTWSSQPTKIPWTFKTTETMYLLEGKVKVSVDGYEGSFEIGAGDLVVFPKGMKITWDVLEALRKHYNLEK